MAKNMNKKIFYDKDIDALWLFVKKGKEAESKEVSPGISIELNDKGELLGIEILNASKIFEEEVKPSKKVNFASAY